MKNKVLKLFAALFLAVMVAIPTLVVTGCKTPTQQKATANTLFTLHKTVDAALDGYLDLVIKGTVATNTVPKVLGAYTTFQSAFNAAVTIVAGNSNAVPTQAVVDAAAAVSSAVVSAQKGGL